jgi:wyosine [tRNA(Phe)-imidazoG37] synthetase (radical SAM superfamily)
MNDHLIVNKDVIRQSIEVVVGDVNVTIRLVILSKEGEPTLDHLLAHHKILAKLLHVRILMIVSQTNNDNIKVLWEKRKTIVHLGVTG